MLNSEYYGLENQIVDMIIENKDKIRFIQDKQENFVF